MKLLNILFAGSLVLSGTHAQASEVKPQNDLERALLLVQTGKLPVHDFFAQHLKSQVVILLDHAPPSSGAWDNSNSPLVLKELNGDRVLAVFTSKERSAPMTRMHMAKRHNVAVLTDFTQVLKGVAPGIGIVINAGWPIGLVIKPSQVVALKVSTK